MVAALTACAGCDAPTTALPLQPRPCSPALQPCPAATTSHRPPPSASCRPPPSASTPPGRTLSHACTCTRAQEACASSRWRRARRPPRRSQRRSTRAAPRRASPRGSACSTWGAGCPWAGAARRAQAGRSTLKRVEMTAALGSRSTARPLLPQPWARALPLLLGSGPSPFEATRQPSSGRPKAEDRRPNPLTGTPQRCARARRSSSTPLPSSAS